jgi:N-formylglutamate deformylase
MKQLILHIPHSSTHIPFLDGYSVDKEILEQEILKLTDWYTDVLYHSENDINVTAAFSRIFCDPERFPDDSLEIMSQYGMGVLYVMADDGRILRSVTPFLREKILKEFYWPHHARLIEVVENQLNLFSQATILDCHSFPDIPLKRSLNKDPDRPDFNLGTDLFHTPQKLIDISIDFFKDKGYSLGINWPYSGTIVPLVHYQKNENVHSVMLEINRKLYLNEPTNEKSSGFEEIKSVVASYIDEIKKHL